MRGPLVTLILNDDKNFTAGAHIAISAKVSKSCFQMHQKKDGMRKICILRVALTISVRAICKEYAVKDKNFSCGMSRLLFNFDHNEQFKYPVYKTLRFKKSQNAYLHVWHKAL